MTVHYTHEEVARIAANHLSGWEIARIVVASLKRPVAFERADGLPDGMLARRFLEIAEQVLNEGKDDDREPDDRAAPRTD